MTQFEVRTAGADGQVMVVLAGECDLSASDQLASALRAALGDSTTVTVDLTELTFLDSSGIHELVAAHHRAAGKGGRVYLTGASGVVAEVLSLTGVAELLRPPPRDNDPSTR